MNKNELLEYIDTNSTAITIFKDKVRTEQEAKNKKRQPAKRWNDAKIERVVNKYEAGKKLSVQNESRTMNQILVHRPASYVHRKSFLI
ncbi:hypothetical protein [Limosilactobacillus reuteri]|uniref:hypothetical protein n=1 Tax=Limosilactobacillus reuteri TaxID=1598 RepID=UPI001E35DF24|nr:hypothetical protein [Limosilactobacillus reuteri]MCC4487408.1 hypothetical protein [Limosilactobacillus reuteri]